MYSWTGHALIFAIAYLFLTLKGIMAGWLGLIAVTLLFTCGLGLILLNLSYFLENGRMRQDEYIKWYIVLPTHLVMLAAALMFVMQMHTKPIDLLISYIILIVYFWLMYDKLESPWILYTDSKISKKRRSAWMHVILGITFIALPLYISLRI